METFEEMRLASEAREARDRHIVDGRVHLCLYFLDANSRLGVKDILHLKKLKKYVNLLPVLVGRDPETDPEEAEAFKDRLLRDCKDYDIDWISIIHELPQFPRLLKENSIKPIKPTPPFWFQHTYDADT